MRKSYLKVLLILLASVGVKAQTITVDVNEYEQEFVGTGASCGLYIGHYLSMSEENQLEAARLLFQDLRLNYIKNYVGNSDETEEDAKSYDKIATAISHAKLYCPDIKVVICTNNLPDHLEEVDENGKVKKGEHDESIPGIMDSIANYYFEVCRGYHSRGHSVDILELVNERGYDDGKVTDLYDLAASKFKVLINDPHVNTTGVPMLFTAT